MGLPSSRRWQRRKPPRLWRRAAGLHQQESQLPSGRAERRGLSISSSTRLPLCAQVQPFSGRKPMDLGQQQLPRGRMQQQGLLPYRLLRQLLSPAQERAEHPPARQVHQAGRQLLPSQLRLRLQVGLLLPNQLLEVGRPVQGWMSRLSQGQATEQKALPSRGP